MYIWFDDVIHTRSGKCVPSWNFTTTDSAVDKELKWFHEGYGVNQLYRLHKVDDENFIAENLRKLCFTSNENWEEYLRNPALALALK